MHMILDDLFNYYLSIPKSFFNNSINLKNIIIHYQIINKILETDEIPDLKDKCLKFKNHISQYKQYENHVSNILKKNSQV